MTDILERLADLHKQAVLGDGLQSDDVMDIAHDAAEEIKKLLFRIETLEQLLSAYMTAQRPRVTREDILSQNSLLKCMREMDKEKTAQRHKAVKKG